MLVYNTVVHKAVFSFDLDVDKMRAVVLFTLIVVFVGIAVGQDAKPKNEIENNVLSLLSKWRAGERGPFPFPLPILNAIAMPSVSGNYEGYGARFKYSTDKLSLLGVNKFSVEQIDISGSRLKASGILTVPSVSAISDKYSVNGRALWFVPISGSGTMNITARNIQLSISIRLRNNSTRMWVESSQLSFKVGGINAKLENSPSAITILLNNSGVSIIQSYHDDIVKVVQGLMVSAIDEFLKGNDIVTPDQLFRLLEDAQAPPPAPPPSVVRV